MVRTGYLYAIDCISDKTGLLGFTNKMPARSQPLAASLDKVRQLTGNLSSFVLGWRLGWFRQLLVVPQSKHHGLSQKSFFKGSRLVKIHPRQIVVR